MKFFGSFSDASSVVMCGYSISEQDNQDLFPNPAEVSIDDPRYTAYFYSLSVSRDGFPVPETGLGDASYAAYYASLDEAEQTRVPAPVIDK